MPEKKKPTTKKAPVKAVKKTATVKADKPAEVVVDEIITETPTAKDATLLKQGRRKLVKDSQGHDKDSGSTEVQIALLTGKINDLVKHLKDHPKDHDSRQGLLKMVGRRRRLLRFLKKGSESKYQGLIAELKLRK